MSTAVATAEPAALPVAAAERVPTVDLVRGLVMVLMVLDHVRDFTSGLSYGPEDLARTTPALFFTRWLTHFCAPTFFLLAGVGAALQPVRRTRDLSRFLVTRGLWLVVLELTVVAGGWSFRLEVGGVAQVIWALGWSMVLMAALVHLPKRLLLAGSLATIAGHHLLDGVRVEGAWAPLWTVLHEPGPVAVGPWRLFVLYTLVPWVAVMALGYAIGDVFRRPADERRRRLVLAGLAATALFAVLRATNAYGNLPAASGAPGAGPFEAQADAAMTVVAFLNVAKYPPSLQYLGMTLGPVLVLLGLLDARAAATWLGRRLVVFGRVPLFFYVLHLYVAHAVAVLLALATGQPAAWLATGDPFGDAPAGYGHDLPVVWATWLGVVALLYPACAWFAALKRRRRDLWWLGYL